MNKKVKYGGLGCLGLIVIFIVLAIIGNMIGPSDTVKKEKKKKTKVEVVDSVKVNKDGEIADEKAIEESNDAEDTDTETIEEKGKEIKEKEVKSRWEYGSEKDKMGAEKLTASLKSKDVLKFKYPYNGGAKSNLMVRKWGNKLDVMYMISKGQIVLNDITDDGTVRMKFDDENPIEVQASTPSDFSSQTIFLEPTNKIINKLKTAKRVVIEIEFYDEGTRQIEFEVAGFKW